jgi:hypothetical protein
MYFGMKNTLKNNNNHTPRHALGTFFFLNHDVYIKKSKKIIKFKL